MGLYIIPCRQCGCKFQWFSGDSDQWCSTCKLYAAIPGPQLPLCEKCGEMLQRDGHHFPDPVPYFL